MKTTSFSRRLRRTRYRVRSAAFASGRPRLSVFRSGRHFSAQIIDDSSGVTLASCSTLQKAWRQEKLTLDLVGKIGESLARSALESGVSGVVFDRGAYAYHGYVERFALAARQGGLKF